MQSKERRDWKCCYRGEEETDEGWWVVGGGGALFYGYIHMLRNKITKNWLKVNYVLLLFEPHTPEHLSYPLSLSGERFISIAEERKKRRGKEKMVMMKKKKDEEEVFFTEKSCTRKDINALAFFPLRLIENYIPSFIRHNGRRARKCQHLLWKIIAHCCSYCLPFPGVAH